jgi:glycosyltransferase involved in cell wall biosynthesis
LVPRASPVELANAIEILLKNRTMAEQFAVRSRQIFQERFTLDRSALRMIDLYHKVAAMQI